MMPKSSTKNGRKSEANPLAGARDFIRAHPAIVLTLIYLQISAVGMIYKNSLFSAFEIDILQFSSPEDFLLAAFSEPFALIYSFAIILAVSAFVVGINIFSHGISSLTLFERVVTRRLLPTFGLAAIILFTLAPPMIAAGHNASAGAPSAIS